MYEAHDTVHSYSMNVDFLLLISELSAPSHFSLYPPDGHGSEWVCGGCSVRNCSRAGKRIALLIAHIFFAVGD